MKTHKQNKQHIPELKNKKRVAINTMIIFGALISVIFFHAFVTYKCETNFLIHKWTWFGKQIPPEWTCFDGKTLQLHKGLKAEYNGKIYYFCGESCYNHFINHLKDKNLKVTDAFTGDTILKCDALIGLRKIGESNLVYFKNNNTLKNYFAQK